MIDTHVHSEFSADSEQSVEELIERAVTLGVTHLAITDHQENEFHPSRWSLDFPVYFEKLNALKEKYADRLTLAIGMEVGYAPQCDGMASKQTQRYLFDTVINSVHNIDGVDLYYETYYLGKTKREAYEKYLRVVLDSVRAPYWFSQVGHLGYIARYARYDDRTMNYSELSDITDEVLRAVIERDAILEMNASVDTGVCTTPESFLRRFYELGGRRIAPASDAHTADKLCRRYADLCALAKSIGFREWTFCYERKMIGIPIV